jgi:two-component system chemotaxis response regulator CheV
LIFRLFLTTVNAAAKVKATANAPSAGERMSQNNILLESGTNELEIVEFYMSEKPRRGRADVEHSYYGINVAKVLEILRVPELSDLPEISHEAVLGAFNLRNRIIPLVDLGRCLRKDVVESEAPKVIVTEFNKTTTAFLVSGVTRIHRVSWSQVESPNRYVASLASNSITGVVKIKDRIIYLLDMEKIVGELSPAAEISALEAPDAVEELRARRVRVLVADDSSLARNMMRDLLVEAGVRVTLASNGREALEQLQDWKRQAAAAGEPLGQWVQAVISDVEMPVMDGHTLTRRIKEDPVLRHVPVVLCSSIVSQNLEHKGESVGADAQLSKADIHELPEVLLRVLS